MKWIGRVFTWLVLILFLGIFIWLYRRAEKTKEAEVKEV